jgi:ABC-type polysaccharide transport system permease subunit
MKSPHSKADYRERAVLLVEAGAAQEVIAAELVKMGASQAEAKRLSARTRRRYQLKKVAPYFVVAVLVTAATYVVFDWQYALVVGLFSLFGLQRLYFEDKRTDKRR